MVYRQVRLVESRVWAGFVLFICVCLSIGCVPKGTTPLPNVVNESTVTPTPTGVGVTSSQPTALLNATRPAAPGVDNQMQDLQTCLLGHWIHSHEEDTSDAMVYRPASYKFPPSRGRVGYEFRPDGKLIYYGIAATDGSEPLSGSWVIEAPNLVRVKVDSQRIQPFVMQVVSCNDQILKVIR
jgi:hypothetical protein